MSAIKVGSWVEVLSPEVGGPPAGHRAQVIETDSTNVLYRVEWGDTGWWYEVDEVRLVDGPVARCSAGALLFLLGEGWVVAASTSSVDGSAVLAFAHRDYTVTVEVGGGTIDVIGSPDPHVFYPRTLRAFADLADEGGVQS
jgi:hypothetical protein